MKEIDPPKALEDRIIRQLRREGLLRRRNYWPYAAIAAAVVLLLVWPRNEARANYILLLYESPQFQGGNREEYSNWARSMRPRIVGGEELDKTDVLATAPQSDVRLAGFFLIAARDDAQATAVARACPHLRHGGSVVLRRIVP